MRSHQVNINTFVACFTTCLARLKFYEGIRQLKLEQVLYFDTDSIVYAWKPGQPALPLKNYLGQFTNELEGDDAIVKFAAAGPKNYGYQIKKGKVECNVRGFCLNARGQEQLNFEVVTRDCSRRWKSNGISWCSTREWWIPRPSCHFPMGLSSLKWMKKTRTTWTFCYNYCKTCFLTKAKEFFT